MKRTTTASFAAIALALCVAPGWPGIGTAGAQSVCADLAGTVDAEGVCHVHDAAPGYQLDFSFPVDYPDQQPVSDYLTQQREGFTDWVARFGQNGSGRPYTDSVTGTTYRSGGTQSLVFEIENDTGFAHEGHPEVSFMTFTYDLGKQAAVTIDTLFAPGTDPVAVLNPIVQQQLTARGLTVGDLDIDSYRNFAPTDEAVIFFLGESQMRDLSGPHQVSVPRSELAGVLA